MIFLLPTLSSLTDGLVISTRGPPAAMAPKHDTLDEVIGLHKSTTMPTICGL